MAVTVKDALRLPSYQDCRLIAGEEGLHNVILYTDSMEVPDIQPWLRNNLFMITTGYSISSSPDGLNQLIRNLHDAGCAGLAIKTKFTGEISADVIETANRLKLPVIQVPDNTPASSLSIPLMNLIYSEQNIQLQSSYFLIDIMNGSISSEEEARLRVQPLNWPKRPLRLLLFHMESEQQSYGCNEGILKESLQFYLKDLSKYVILPNNEKIVMILPDTYKSDFLRKMCENVCVYTQNQFRLPVFAGISDSAANYTDLHQAFLDALDAIRIGMIEQPGAAPFFISDFRLEQALLDLKGNQRIKKCMDETFSVLQDYDRLHDSNLLETLKMLTQCLGSKAQAADRLFLHRNTLIYRIKKIEELTGFDLNENDTISRLSFLFRIQPYL